MYSDEAVSYFIILFFTQLVCYILCCADTLFHIHNMQLLKLLCKLGILALGPSTLFFQPRIQGFLTPTQGVGVCICGTEN